MNTTRPNAVAFVRALNGAPSNRIKNQTLIEVLTQTGIPFTNLYLHTGNILLAVKPVELSSVSKAIETALINYGMKSVQTVIVSLDELKQLISKNPFKAIDSKQYKRCITFFTQPILDMDHTIFKKLDLEVVYSTQNLVCVAVPKDNPISGGISAVVEKKYKTPSTTRWWNVIKEIVYKFNEHK